jgi:hypothetical protein
MWTATIGRLRSRRGIIALGFAVVFMILLLTTMSGFMLTLMTGGARSEDAIRRMQAMQAAQAGLDVALQSGGAVTGECGRARYAAVRSGGRVAALGQVSVPSGAAVRRLVTARASGSGIARGSWREPPPATRPDLARMLEAQ